MARKTKIWLIVALSLILAGGILFTGVMMALNWDFGNLSTMQFEENTYEITSDFSDINIMTDTADVTFYHAKDGKTTVVCYEHEKVTHEVAVIGGALTVAVKDTRNWYEHIGINFKQPKIKVYLPQEAYGKLRLNTTTGDMLISGGFTFEKVDVSARTGDVFCWASAEEKINVEVTTGNIRLQETSAQSVELIATTGDIRMENVRACNTELHLSTGDVYMRNVVLDGELSVRGTTGSIRMYECDAKSVYIKLNTGDVGCNFLSPKAVHAYTNTGSVDYPPDVTGEPCEITTTTGNIRVSYQ